MNAPAHKLFGAILLVAGCCMGAGMLGLPLVTASAGFLPTVVTFTLSWAFMAITGLLLLEVNLWFGKGVNLMTLAEKTLGSTAKILVGVLFFFLFQCLNVAYLAGGGAIIAEAFQNLTGVALDPYIGSIALALIFGVIVFFGTGIVDLANRWMMIALFLSYGGLLLFGIPEMVLSSLKLQNWSFALFAFPAMIISFGYHNLIPSLTDYLDGNVRQLRASILIGTLIPLLAYLLWDGMILAILPTEDSVQKSIDNGAMVTALLQKASGSFAITYLMEIFAFFALATSFIAVALSFVDFLSDGLHIKKTKQGKLLLITLVILPPLIFTYIYPTLFLKALNYAGAFGAVLLFGIIPVLMVWKGRYVKKLKGAKLVPGGKIVLLLTGTFALFVFLLQLKFELGI